MSTAIDRRRTRGRLRRPRRPPHRPRLRPQRLNVQLLSPSTPDRNTAVVFCGKDDRATGGEAVGLHGQSRRHQRQAQGLRIRRCEREGCRRARQAAWIGIGHTRAVADAEDDREKLSPGASGQERGFGDLRHYVPQDIINVSFPVSVRGYDRRAVDAYVKRVNRAIAELKVSASPPAAVRHALEQAGQQVHGLLQSARETAEEIAASARQEAEESIERAKAHAADLVVNSSAEADRVHAEADTRIATARTEADDTLAKAKAEAEDVVAQARGEAKNTLTRARAEADESRRRLQEELAALQEQAETRMRELHADTEAVWIERGQLLDGIRELAGGLVDLADAAAARFPRRGPSEGEVDLLEPEARDESEPPGVATKESTPAVPSVGSHDGGDDESRDETAELPERLRERAHASVERHD
jgi:DivIVA domain-containing protein